MAPRLPAVDPGRLGQWCEEQLGSPPAGEIFRSGYLSVVIGLRLAAYCHEHGRELSADELERSWAAGAWTLAYDARYQHAVGQPVRSLTENALRERLHRAGIG